MGIFDKIKQILNPKENNTSRKKANDNKQLKEEDKKNNPPSIKQEESTILSESQSTGDKDLSIDKNLVEEASVDLDSIDSSEIGNMSVHRRQHCKKEPIF